MLERDIKLNISKMTQKIVKKFSSPEKISKNVKKFQKFINLKIPLQKIKNPNFYCDNAVHSISYYVGKSLRFKFHYIANYDVTMKYI